MNAKEMWDAFVCQHPGAAKVPYEAWAYGDDPDKLALLTVEGIKRATASAYDLYIAAGEPIPKAGDYSVIEWSDGTAACVVCTTAVTVLPFRDIPAEFARKEGEGDLSLAYWRKVHEKFFADELKQIATQFSENMLVVCEEFEVVFKSISAESAVPQALR